MWIDGIETGKEFEDLIIRILQDTGMTVHDTPVTGDYGADLIIEFKGYRIAGQCKYYSNAVGVSAVQEVLGSLAYYDCDGGVVFTNDIFTQQAMNLAAANKVLLVDGNMLKVGFKDFSMFNSLFSGFFLEKQRLYRQSEQTEEWTINDLIVRYGTSGQTIMKNFLGYGLPYFKVGREFRFKPREVYWWEVDMHQIPFGRNDIYLLPGYEHFRVTMNKRIKEAKRSGNRKEARKLKKIMRSHHVSRLSDSTKQKIAKVIPVISTILLLWGIFMIFRNPAEIERFIKNLGIK